MCWFLPSWKWCWRWWRPWQFLCLSPQSSSAVPSCLKRQINIGFKGGMMCLWNSGTLSDCPPLMIPALGDVSGTCTAAPWLFIGIPCCGFLPFYFSVCKFTILTSGNLQFAPHPPEPFTSCRGTSNVWFSKLWHSKTFHRTYPPHPIPFTPTKVGFTLFLVCKQKCTWGRLGNTKCDLWKVWSRKSLISAGGIVFFRGRWAVLGCCHRMWLCQVQNLWGELPVLSLLSPSSSGGKTNCSRGIQSCHHNCSLKDTGAGAAAAKWGRCWIHPFSPVLRRKNRYLL